jgi:hypothetical protein
LLSLAVVALLCAGALLALPRTARADGSWIDAPLQNWNVAGADLPAAPAPSNESQNPRCAGAARPAETDEDNAVAAAGWTLVGSYEGGWGLKVIIGTSSYDGMCRPLGFQVFVFADGWFAGTISPVTMDSRTDGVVDRVTITPPGDGLVASFGRYTPSDPLCCASSTSTVQYHIDRSGGAPVLVPVSASTNPNS